MMAITFRLILITFLIAVSMVKFPAVKAATFESINTFDLNWQEVKPNSSNTVDFSPPSSENSTFLWRPGTFGACFGCGIKSYRQISHDCVHRLPVNLSAGSYVKSLTGFFKVPQEECLLRKINPPAPISVLGCGPPCSQLRLLRGDLTGCRCQNDLRLAFETPKLTCQDDRNRTVSLSLCQTIYEMNTRDYIAVPCNYEAVCSRPSEWIVGNWTACSVTNSHYQSREVFCAVKLPNGVYLIMHKSMCDRATRPPVTRLCARWTAEKTFKCECLNYMAKRIVICLRGRIKKALANDAECGWHDKPAETRPCTETERSKCRRLR